MPQLVPYFFLNQASFAIVGLALTIYLMGVYVLPAFTELFLSRVYITRL